MNARVKRATAAPAHETANEDGLIVGQRLRKRPMFDDDGRFTGWIRRVIVDRANKDLQDPPEVDR